jgi:hypothetical protein
MSLSRWYSPGRKRRRPSEARTYDRPPRRFRRGSRGPIEPTPDVFSLRRPTWEPQGRMPREGQGRESHIRLLPAPSSSSLASTTDGEKQ